MKAKLLRLVAVAVAVMAIAACGDDDADSTVDPAGDGTGAEDGGEETASPGGEFDCPLSAEEVSSVLGADLEKNDGACLYSPGSGGLPLVAFNPSFPETCTQEWATGNGYTETVTGLDVGAYGKTDGGAATAELLVCSEAPFFVAVDVVDGDTAVALTAAEDLATMVLDAG